MPLAATIQWEVRPTNGGANNGGGFNSAAAGTDRSQQNAAQVVIDNAAITCTTPAANSNTLTFTAGYVASAADVGNVVAITAGTNINANLYEITAFTNAPETWTVTGSTNLTTAGGAGSNITGNMGGARSGFSAGTTTIQSRYVAGNKFWVKNEAWNEAVNLATAGAAGNPVVVEGYNAARGDITIASGNANNPTNNRASAAGDGFTIGGSNIQVRNITVQNAGDAGFSLSAAVTPFFVNCKAKSCTGESLEVNNSQNIFLIAFEADSCGGALGTAGVAGSFFGYGLYLHDGSINGVLTTTGQLNLSFSIIDSNASHGISGTTSLMILSNNTIYNSSGANQDGVNVTTPINGSFLLNNIFSNNARYGVNATDADSVYEDYNDFFGNGTAPRNPATGSAGGWGPGANDSTLDPTFTNAGAGDFSIGSNLAALGWPGAFPAGLSIGYLDMGAVQRQAGSGGGQRVYGE